MIPFRQNDEFASLLKDVDIFAGYIKRLENPDPVLLAKGEGRGLKLYDEVSRDPVASAVLDTLYLSVSGREIESIPYSDNQVDIKISDFVFDSLMSTNFSQFVYEMMSAYLYGFAASEIIWKYDKQSNQILIDKFIKKHQRRFCFDAFRNPRLLTLENFYEGVPLPDRKFIFFRCGDTDNPYGKGVGQAVWYPIWYKKNVTKFWVTCLDRYATPATIGVYDPTATEREQQSLQEAIETLQRETAIKIPQGTEIKYLEATRNAALSYSDFCNYMDMQVTKAILGQNLTTEVSGGSYAAAETHKDILVTRVKALADSFAEVLNKTVVKWLVDYNYPAVEGYPSIWFKLDSAPDLAALAARDRILTVDIGLEVDAGYFYDTYNLPRPEQGKPVIGGVKPQPSDKQNPPSVFAEKKQADESDPVLDTWNQKNGVTDDVIDKMLEPVIAEIMNAKSWAEIGENIYKLYPDIDSSTFQEMLARAMFGAGLKGVADVTDGE